MSQGDEARAAERYARMGKSRMNEDDARAGPSIPAPVPTAEQRSNVHRVLNAVAPMGPLYTRPFLPDPEPAPSPMSRYYSGSSLPTPKPEPSLMIPVSNGRYLPAPEPAAPIFVPSSFPPTTQTIASYNPSDEYYANLVKKAEERAARIIHEKEMLLYAQLTENIQREKELAQCQGQIAKLLKSSSYMEKTLTILQKEMQASKERYPNVDTGEELTAESSYVNTGQVPPVRLDCMVCKKVLANIIMWNCRHISICSECNKVTIDCPVCGQQKHGFTEVIIPTYDD